MLVMIGASASGKTEAAKQIINKYGFEKMITYTTRSMRPGEVNGVDYHFISKEEFLNRDAKNEFLETTVYRDNYYGTAFKDADYKKVLIVDPSGANKIYEKLKERVTIFYLDAPKEVRRLRMLNRQDNPEEIQKRLDCDDAYFSPENIIHVDYVINSSDCTISELADRIYQLYEMKHSK